MTTHTQLQGVAVERRHRTGRSTSLRRGAAAGVAGLVGLAAAALGVVGVAQGASAAQQRDVALTSGFDHSFDQQLLDSQVAFDHSLNTFQLDYQTDFYYTAAQLLGEKTANALLLIDPTAEPFDTNVLNGAVTRFSQLNEVDHAALQAEWDHFVGVNQTVPGGGEPGGYEHYIGTAIYSDLSGTGIQPGSALDHAVAAFAPGEIATTYSQFHTDLFDLQIALFNTGVSDFFGGLF